MSCRKRDPLQVDPLQVDLQRDRENQIYGFATGCLSIFAVALALILVLSSF